MRLGFLIGSKSTGKFRILMQRKGESMAYSVGRRHKTLDAAKREADKLVDKHEPTYVEIVDGQHVYSHFIAQT